MSRRVAPSLVVALALAAGGCSSSSGSCIEDGMPRCSGNGVATCGLVQVDPSCSGALCDSKTQWTITPCPAEAPVCEDLPLGVTGTTTACQVQGLDKSCALVAIPGAASASLVADFNHDGHVDFISRGSGAFTVFLGAGDGTFHALPPQSWPNSTGQVLVGDFNGDGAPDLAFDVSSTAPGDAGASASGADPPGVAYGKGDGTFGPSEPVPQVSQAVGRFSLFAAADINGDHVDDLLGFDEVYLQIRVVLGGAQLTPLPPQRFSSCGSTTCFPIAVADFEGSGSADVLVAGGGTVGVLRGSPTGVFSAIAASFVTAGWGPGVFAQDFDGDGRGDLIGWMGPGPGLALGRGDGTFAAPVMLSAGPYSASVVFAGDEDADGRLDVVLSDVTARVLVVLDGAGGGTFGAPHFYQPALELPSVVGVLDSGASGHRDLLVNSGSGGAAVLPGRCR